ncbi:hypothetical protein [Undibacterium sp. TS12]|uniref:InlB B-repeat-containing protein n=1 Tax=Undibacterium sp. TS12 TaxID=2908202 RepID=UPI001F4C5BFB|nr:hypothetical protein [Undibacterium sp. TS12]MCH8620353.1 hypothetical protein [Undibacterium sp. TS12]
MRRAPVTLASMLCATTCLLSVAHAQTQNGSFNLTVSQTGVGRITSDLGGIRCDNTCTVSFNAGSIVTLTAIPANKYMTLGSWGGACSGNSPTCEVKMNSAKTVTATFKYAQLPGNPSSPTGAPVTIKWKAPVTKADGAALIGLTGYKIYGSKTQYDLAPTLLTTVQNPQALSASVSGLTIGTWYFWVSATTNEAESELQYLNQAVVAAAP